LVRFVRYLGYIIATSDLCVKNFIVKKIIEYQDKQIINILKNNKNILKFNNYCDIVKKRKRGVDIA